MKETWLFRGFVGDELLPSYIGIMLPSLYRKGLSSSKMNHPFFNGHLFLHPKPKGALFPERKNRGARPENTPVCTDTFFEETEGSGRCGVLPEGLEVSVLLGAG